jgi:hypothetical protein
LIIILLKEIILNISLDGNLGNYNMYKLYFVNEIRCQSGEIIDYRLICESDILDIIYYERNKHIHNCNNKTDISDYVIERNHLRYFINWLKLKIG